VLFVNVNTCYRSRCWMLAVVSKILLVQAVAAQQHHTAAIAAAVAVTVVTVMSITISTKATLAAATAATAAVVAAASSMYTQVVLVTGTVILAVATAAHLR
jgi:hypothetical protein